MKKMSSEELYAKYSLINSDKLKVMPAQLFYQLIGFKKTKAQVNRLPTMNNDIPIIIVSSSDMEKNAPIKGDWYNLQKQWLNKNANSKILKVQSGHFIQLEHPRLICNNLKKLVDLLKSSRA